MLAAVIVPSTTVFSAGLSAAELAAADEVVAILAGAAEDAAKFSFHKRWVFASRILREVFPVFTMADGGDSNRVLDWLEETQLIFRRSVGAALYTLWP